MRFRFFAFALLVVAAASAATRPPPKAIAPKAIAPATIPHPIAMFLGGLSKDGKEKVTFRATAIGTHFFLEEPAGVSVYVFDDRVGYRKEAFIKGSTLASALKKYRSGGWGGGENRTPPPPPPPPPTPTCSSRYGASPRSLRQSVSTRPSSPTTSVSSMRTPISRSGK